MKKSDSVKSKQEPFFVKFLETPQVKTGVKAGQLTHKYPTDREEVTY
jgi:hypothetical protein